MASREAVAAAAATAVRLLHAAQISASTGSSRARGSAIGSAVAGCKLTGAEPLSAVAPPFAPNGATPAERHDERASSARRCPPPSNLTRDSRAVPCEPVVGLGGGRAQRELSHPLLLLSPPLGVRGGIAACDTACRPAAAVLEATEAGCLAELATAVASRGGASRDYQAVVAAAVAPPGTHGGSRVTIPCGAQFPPAVSGETSRVRHEAPNISHCSCGMHSGKCGAVPSSVQHQPHQLGRAAPSSQAAMGSPLCCCCPRTKQKNAHDIKHQPHLLGTHDHASPLVRSKKMHMT